MKPQPTHNIHQKITIHTTLSPQLIENIQLLTLPSAELLEVLQKEVDANPLLELETEEEDTPPSSPINEQWDVSDSDWSYKMNSSRESPIPTQPSEEAFSLQSSLEWQAQLAHFSALEFAIAMVIIDSIDEQGFLTCPLEQIAETLKLSDDKLPIITAVQQHILTFEPLGVGARSAKEYLLCQLDHSAKDHTDYSLARYIVEHALTALSQHDITHLKRITHAPTANIHAAIVLIVSLPPYPCAQYHYQPLDPIAPPDLYLVHQQGQWQVRLNPKFACRLTIDTRYARIVVEQGAHYPQMKEQLKQARWLQKGLLHRQDSLLRVTEYIFSHQKMFFEEGVRGLTPLNLADISSKTELHISSVSRIIQNKTIQTPRGLFELRYFLTSGSDTQKPVTKRASLAALKDLINKEPKDTPYSDEQLRLKLAEQDIQLSRRAITKYRQQLGIEATHLRRRVTIPHNRE